jgi:hypothetical protein
MAFMSDIYNQDITYWEPTGNMDRFGKPTVLAPVSIKGRWESVSEIFNDRQGREIRSEAVVFVDTEVAEEGWLFLGTSTDTDPANVSGALEIKKFEKTPNLDQTDFEMVAML